MRRLRGQRLHRRMTEDQVRAVEAECMDQTMASLMANGGDAEGFEEMLAQGALNAAMTKLHTCYETQQASLGTDWDLLTDDDWEAMDNACLDQAFDTFLMNGGDPDDWDESMESGTEDATADAFDKCFDEKFAAGGVSPDTCESNPCVWEGTCCFGW